MTTEYTLIENKLEDVVGGKVFIDDRERRAFMSSLTTLRRRHTGMIGDRLVERKMSEELWAGIVLYALHTFNANNNSRSTPSLFQMYHYIENTFNSLNLSMAQVAEMEDFYYRQLSDAARITILAASYRLLEGYFEYVSHVWNRDEPEVAKFSDILNHKDYLDSILIEGARKAESSRMVSFGNDRPTHNEGETGVSPKTMIRMLSRAVHCSRQFSDWSSEDIYKRLFAKMALGETVGENALNQKYRPLAIESVVRTIFQHVTGCLSEQEFGKSE